MIFETKAAATQYARDITADMRGIYKHKAVAAKAWKFDRFTGEYELVNCWTVILK